MRNPEVLGVTGDPIVSSDVRHCTQSLLVDLHGITCCGDHLLKVLGWQESLGHAHRVSDVVSLYHELDAGKEAR